MNEKSSEHNSQPPPPHPDFDGHLERPLSEMTIEERLDWAWQGAVLLHWARQQNLRNPRDDDESSSAS